MRKVYLSVVGFALVCRLNAYAQTKPDTNYNKQRAAVNSPVDIVDSNSYKSRALHIDEIDFVSSYYKQTGDHSPVTGGIGTEAVTDISNGLNLNLVWLNQNYNKNTLAVGLGFDHHTSASAAYVALNGGSSTGGTRIYPSLDWSVENAKTGNTFGIGAYYSGEYNYKSKGLDLHFSQKTADKNGEFSAKFQGYFDNVTLIYPSEFIPKPTTTTTGGGTTVVTTASGNSVILSSNGTVISNSKNELSTSPRTTLSASFGYSQQISSRLQVQFLGDLVTQSGYLGLPFHRVYFNTGKDTIEKLPASRFKLPLGFRLNYFLGDDIIIRSYYRFYTDNWGVVSNTASVEVPFKVTPFFSISPFYRYYTQTASTYFAPYEVHKSTDQYFTSNYEYAKFNSSFFGIGFRIAPPKGVLGWQGLHALEIRYGHYIQSTDLMSDVVSLGLSFK